jgi:hypothetical protein
LAEYGGNYLETALVEFDHVEQVFWKVLKNKEHFILFLKGLFYVDNELPFQHLEHPYFPLNIFTGNFVIIAFLELLDGD